MRTLKETSELIEKVVQEILNSGNQNNEWFISKVCEKYDITKEHIIRVGNFLNKEQDG